MIEENTEGPASDDVNAVLTESASPVDGTSADNAPTAASDDVAAPTATRQKIGRRGWIGIATATAVIIGGAIAVPAVVQAAELSAAQEAFSTAAAQLDDARKDYVKADASFGDRVSQAEKEYEEFRGIEAALPADLVDPVSAREEFVSARDDFIASTALALNEDGTIAEEQPQETFTVANTPEAAPTASELNAQVAAIRADAEAVSAETKALIGRESEVDSRYNDVVTALDGLLRAAAAKGATLAFEKAGQVERDAFASAVAGLVLEKDGKQLTVEEKSAALTAYASARAAAQASADAAVAAEEAAAEKAQRQRANASNQTSDRDSNGGSNSGNKGGSDRAPRKNNNPGTSGGSNAGSTGGSNRDNSDGSDSAGSSTPARGSVLYQGRSCVASYGSGGSVGPNNWTSNIVIPADAVVTSVNEDKGVSWSVSFAC